jgi:hypothetical protein
MAVSVAKGAPDSVNVASVAALIMRNRRLDSLTGRSADPAADCAAAR